MESGIGSDILMGTDMKLDVEDIWTNKEMARGGEYHEVMQKMRGL